MYSHNNWYIKKGQTTSLLSGCDKVPDGDSHSSQTYSWDETVVGYVPYSYEKDYPYPYWVQDWKDGIWEPCVGYDKTKCFKIGNTFEGYQLYLSINNSGGSSFKRVIVPEQNKQKVIWYDSGGVPLEYYDDYPFTWISGDSYFCANFVYNGYILVVAYDHNLYMIKFIDISEEFINKKGGLPKYTVDIAEITGTPLLMNMGDMNWNRQDCLYEIPFANREISVSVNKMLTKKNDFSETYFYRFFYDFSYGGYPGMKRKKSDDWKPAHIAIVPADYLEGKSTIDLTKFRFKTWEDGLGIYGDDSNVD